MRPRSPWCILGRLICRFIVITPVDVDDLDRYIASREKQAQEAEASAQASHG